jgi:hypothetical protein
VVTPALTFSDIVQHPTDANVMYAARVGVAGSAVPAGLWRSTDRGATWESVTTFAGDSVRRIEIAVSAARPGSVWMIAGRADRQLAGLWRWDDATNSRITLDALGPRNADPNGRLNFGGQSEYNLMIAVDPSDAEIVYIGACARTGAPTVAPPSAKWRNAFMWTGTPLRSTGTIRVG